MARTPATPEPSDERHGTPPAERRGRQPPAGGRPERGERRMLDRYRRDYAQREAAAKGELPRNARGIIDRRRFPDFRSELIYARILAASVAGAVAMLVTWLYSAVFMAIAFRSMSGGPGPAMFLLLLPVVLVAPASLAAPSSVAKRGRIVFLLTMLAIIGAHVATYLGIYFTGVQMTMRNQGALLGVTGAAIGVTEGIFEKSVATTYAGLLGGAFGSAITGMVLSKVIAPLLIGGGGGVFSGIVTIWFFTTVQYVGIHLCVGVSLALGRRLRDLPQQRTSPPRPRRDPE